MRTWMMCLISLLFTQVCNASLDFNTVDSLSKVYYDQGAWTALATLGRTAAHEGISYAGLSYKTGVAFYKLGKLSQAERFLYRAFLQNDNLEIRELLVLVLDLQGKDLEASALRARSIGHHAPMSKPWEAVYAEAGTKYSQTVDQASDIHYGAVGLLQKLQPDSRLWHQAYFLTQARNEGSIAQYGYFGSWRKYLGKHCYLTPIVSYAFTNTRQNNSLSQTQQGDTNYVLPTGVLTYTYAGVQHTNYDVTLKSNFLLAGISLARTIGAFQFVLEPALHLSTLRVKSDYSYGAAGRIDSLFNGIWLGSQPYQANGSGTLPDTKQTTWNGQLGIGFEARLPLWHQRISLGGMAYWVGNDTTSERAWLIRATVRAFTLFWFQGSVLSKGFMPLMLSQEGSYFNLLNNIQARYSATVQLFPLKRNSLALTVQREEQRRFPDKSAIQYQSLFLTFKHNL